MVSHKKYVRWEISLSTRLVPTIEVGRQSRSIVCWGSCFIPFSLVFIFSPSSPPPLKLSLQYVLSAYIQIKLIWGLRYFSLTGTLDFILERITV